MVFEQVSAGQKPRAKARGNLFAHRLEQKTIISAVVGLILAVLVLPPLYFLFIGAVTVDEGGQTRYTLERFVMLLSQRGILISTFNSFVFAIGSALLSLLIGGLAAWLVERTNAPLKSLTYLTNVIALGTPYVLYTSAWLLLLARSGPINTWYRQLSGETGVIINVYGMGGMILIEGLLWSPLVFLLLGATLRNFNPALEEAARMSGATTWGTIRRVTLPLSMPAILALSMLVFIRTVEAFEVPALVGLPGRVHVLTTDIYEMMHRTMPPDIGSASALSLILLFIVGALLFWYSRLTRNAEKFATVTGKSFRPNQIDLGAWRPLAGFALAFYFFLLIVLPAFILVWASLLPFYQTFRSQAFPLLTLDNYRAVLNSPRYISLLINTLLIAFATASAVMLITAISAWLTVRKAPGARVLDNLGTAPLVFPGIVLGVGVMQFFLQVPVGIYGTIWIIVWALVINYLPYGVRYSYAGMIQLHRELEEAASAAGATPFTGFRRIVFPLLTPSLIAGWLFIFLLATRVLSLPVLLSGPSSQTMAVAMFDLWGNGQGPELAALGLMWSLSMTCIAVVFYLVAQRGGGLQRA
ncbi:MAG: iron ABC transporter permease [Beijerinckiaceae bacterium]|nr:iron ABC transporter permease [Beijerinckiaceae bacterium]